MKLAYPNGVRAKHQPLRISPLSSGSFVTQLDICAHVSAAGVLQTTNR